MALDKTAVLTWVRNNITSITPDAPASAISTAYIDPDDYYMLDGVPKLPFHGIFYDVSGVTYRGVGVGNYQADWTLVIETYLHRGDLQRFSKHRAELQRVGREWANAVTNWLLSNRTLGGTTKMGIGDNDGLVTSYELVSLRPWDNIPVFGSLVIVPMITNTG